MHADVPAARRIWSAGSWTAPVSYPRVSTPLAAPAPCVGRPPLLSSGAQLGHTRRLIRRAGIQVHSAPLVPQPSSATVTTLARTTYRKAERRCAPQAGRSVVQLVDCPLQDSTRTAKKLACFQQGTITPPRWSQRHRRLPQSHRADPRQSAG